MGAVTTTQRMTAAQYVEWEREQPERHEFHRGEVFAMAGGSARHNFLSVSVAAELRAVVRGKGCHTLSSDQRISTKQGEHYVYADVVVACGAVVMEAGTRDVLANPSVVVEVVSPSTEAYDRGAKWEAYQRVASLTDYLLVEQLSARIEHYCREADGSWRYRVRGAGETVVLANGAALRVDAVYAGSDALEAG